MQERPSGTFMMWMSKEGIEAAKKHGGDHFKKKYGENPEYVMQCMPDENHYAIGPIPLDKTE